MRTKEEYENALDDFEIKYQIYLVHVKKECLAQCEKDLEHNLELFRELIDSVKELVWIPIKREYWGGEVDGECRCGAWVSDKEDYCCLCGTKFDWESKDPAEDNT